MSLPNSAESREKELRVVAIGGGTGLSTLLRGLKRYVASSGPAERNRIGRRGWVRSCSGLPCPVAAVRDSASFRRW